MGFPVDLTADVARECGLTVDMEGFEIKMKKQKDRARNAGAFDDKKSIVVIDDETKFLGYELFDNTATVSVIIKDDQLVNSISEGDEAIVILDQSSFYGESGGQTGRSWLIVKKRGKI